MARTKAVAGRDGTVYVPLTPEEESIRDEQEAVALAEIPLANWKREMYKADQTMIPRHVEDLITDNPALVVNASLKTKYDEKVLLREQRP